MSSLYWLRSDLRFQDNEGVLECHRVKDVTVVFAQTKSFLLAGPQRTAFVKASFNELKNKLELRGFRVLSTNETFYNFLVNYASKSPLESVFWTREYAWDERQEEALVRSFCLSRGISTQEFDQVTLLAEDELPFSIQEMPFVFSDFRKKVESQLIIRPELATLKLNTNPEKKSSSEMSFVGGETSGLSRLNHYLWKSHSIQTYKDTRNGLLHFDDSSKLSPWLNTGSLSPRTVYHQLKDYETSACANASTYWLLFELLWRDYFKFFSLKYGRSIFTAKGVMPGSSPNKRDLSKFNLWCEGKTSCPFVNANMHELNSTGWMSNRGRQNVASYLIHDLGLVWTWGADYFERKLIDYDPDLNWGNWLYLSGRGSDPRARRFNTAKQASVYDPESEYQKKWS